MLRSLSVAPQRWPLNAPFRISRGVKTAAEVVVVEARRGALVGRGEAVPYPRYGESVESVIAQVETVMAAFAEGACDVRAMLEPGAALNAVDCALWDLEARESGRTVAQMTGLTMPDMLATAVTVSLDEPGAMAVAARKLRGAPLVKIKVDADRPAEKIEAVAREVPGSRLIVDPNESWTIAILEAVRPLVAAYDVALFEQPLPADADGDLEGYTPAAPICADEAVHTVDDLPRLRGRYQAVNIKLDKTGGLTGAIALLQAARAQGFVVMTGCMVASSLAIAPALHIAGASDFADLDGPWWLAQDLPGGCRFEGGRLLRPAPGFWGESAQP